jgi:transcriptional regulator with XRE-family HTH domain
MADEKAARFGALLHERRKAARLSQRDLAEQVQADFTYLSKIEHGHMRPSAELTERLAKALGADPMEFWEAAGNTPAGALRAEIARLREALADYGKHYSACPAEPSWDGRYGECNCGLSALLAGKV